MLAKEEAAGITTSEYYQNFQSRVDNVKNNMLTFLLEKYKAGKKVIGYGAAAKGNTLLNYAGIKGDNLIKFVVDAAPSKNRQIPSRQPYPGIRRKQNQGIQARLHYNPAMESERGDHGTTRLCLRSGIVSSLPLFQTFKSMMLNLAAGLTRVFTCAVVIQTLLEKICSSIWDFARAACIPAQADRIPLLHSRTKSRILYSAGCYILRGVWSLAWL